MKTDHGGGREEGATLPDNTCDQELEAQKLVLTEKGLKGGNECSGISDV